MPIEKLIFWIVTVTMLCTVLRTTLDIANPSKDRKNILKSFNAPAKKFWIGIVFGFFNAVLMIDGFYFAKFRWLWLALGVFNIIALTLISVLAVVSRNINIADRLKEDYWPS